MKRPPAFCVTIAVILATLGIAENGLAQERFPNRALKVILPIGPGSGADSAARFFCGEIATFLGEPCVVENRAGANGVIGAMAAKQAPADGYTIFFGSNSPMAVNPATMQLPYDPVKDFRPIYGLTRHTNVIVVPASSPVRTLRELVDAGRQRQLNAGVYATLYELATNWLSTLSSTKFVNVPYKAQPPVAADLMAGRLDFAIVDLAGASPLLTSQKVRGVAVLGDRPHPSFPDIPPAKDSGYPEFVNYSWTAFYVRAEVPEEIAARLVEATKWALEKREAVDFVRKFNLELMPLPPAEMRRFQIAEIERFKRIALAAQTSSK